MLSSHTPVGFNLSGRANVSTDGAQLAMKKRQPCADARSRAGVGSADAIARDAPRAVRIERLQVRIVTSRKRGAGTDNAVYFDIGPLAWKLNKPHHDDFERGSRDTYELPLGCADLTTDDILWVRLQKKGLFGVLGTRDGLTGAWETESLQLIVNGREEPRFNLVVGVSLNSRCWMWKAELVRFKPDTDEERFLRSLRLNINRKLSWLDKASALVTTPLFKERGISGWLPQPQPGMCECCAPSLRCASPLPRTCATGVVVQSGRSSDGLATIDLRAEEVEFCPGGTQPCAPAIPLDEAHGIRQPRFLRIEYRYGGARVPRDGDRVRICGEVWWDTDREGWYELHARGSSDVRFLNEPRTQ
ncbi:MAG: hypothetical protein LC746_11110 [Acidobacteria bacterium]|nr:hypothetical protein [Acidobacteriota bacterium]